MKPVMKDKPRQRRRERTLARLESVLKGGVKTIKVETADLNVAAEPGMRLTTKVVDKVVPLVQGDIDRITAETNTLKLRLGVTVSPLVYNSSTREYAKA